MLHRKIIASKIEKKNKITGLLYQKLIKLIKTQLKVINIKFKRNQEFEKKILMNISAEVVQSK